MTSHKFACVLAAMLDDKLGKDISILNISHVSSMADYFVIVTGDSTPHVKALMETVKERTKKELNRNKMRYGPPSIKQLISLLKSNQ